MFRNVLIAVAIMIANPTLVDAQDIFWSFSPTELVTEWYISSPDPCVDPTAYDPSPVSGSAYIFSDGLFGFGSIDLDFVLGDSSEIRVTGGEVFNPTFTTIGGTRYDFPEISFETPTFGENTGRLFIVNLFQNGVDPNLSALYDPGFQADVGPNGAVLLARVDFEILGFGPSAFDFSLGVAGVGTLPPNSPGPSFGSATVERIPPHVGTCPGDIDYSGDVNFQDIPPFINVLISGDYHEFADMNADGAVDFNDIPPFIGRLLIQ